MKNISIYKNFRPKSTGFINFRLQTTKKFFNLSKFPTKIDQFIQISYQNYPSSSIFGQIPPKTFQLWPNFKFSIANHQNIFEFIEITHQNQPIYSNFLSKLTKYLRKLFNSPPISTKIPIFNHKPPKHLRTHPNFHPKSANSFHLESKTTKINLWLQSKTSKNLPISTKISKNII